MKLCRQMCKYIIPGIRSHQLPFRLTAFFGMTLELHRNYTHEAQLVSYHLLLLLL